MKAVQKLLSSTMAMALTLGLVLPVGTLAAKSFTDVKGHWATASINSAVNRGYINGYENGSFQPNKSVTRAEFCKMLNNALGLKHTISVSFGDMTSADWYYNEVAKSVAAGYISGYEDESFRADAFITRQEAAVVISRIVSGAETTKDLSGLRDGSQIASWAKDGAQTVYSKGYMEGDQRRNFNPAGNLTRAEAVKIIEGILSGENVSSSDASFSTANQTLSNTVYTGSVTVQTTGTTNFENCRMLGGLTVQNEGTVRLENTKVPRLTVSNQKAEIVASGTSVVSDSHLSGGGGSLTESLISGEGFVDVTVSGSSLSRRETILSGSFGKLVMQTPAKLRLQSGRVGELTVNAAAGGSQIELATNTLVEKAVLNDAVSFTGRGTIQLAVINSGASTFETEPLRTEGTRNMTPTISPKHGATGVSVTENIVLTFGEIPYTSSNTVVTTSYVENSVVELRQGSETGSKLGFDVSLASNNRVMTINPDSNLKTNTKYYVIVKSALRNSQKQTNSKTVYSFSTSNTIAPTPYPADGATHIPVTTQMRLEFSQAMYQPGGESLTSSYLKNTALELRSGSRNGSTVNFSASISSDRRTITINPTGNLSTSTKYFIILRDGTVATSNRSTLSEQVYSFTTASSSTLVPSMSPSPGSNNVSLNTDIVLNFDTTIYTSSGGTVSTSYLENDVFTLRRDSATGSTTSFDASIDSGKTRVTLDPDSNLRANTTYYLVMEDSSLADGSGSSRRKNDRLVLSFYTGDTEGRRELDPAVNPKDGATGVSNTANITLSFDERMYRSNSSMSSLSDSYLESSVVELRSGSENGDYLEFSATTNSSDTTITINPRDNFTMGKRYYVIVRDSSLQNRDGNKNQRFVSTFTCGNATGTLSNPSISPANGSTGNAPETDIVLNFSERLYDNSGNSLSNDTTAYVYLQRYAFVLRRDNETTGSLVPFTVTNLSSNRNVTIDPNTDLIPDRTYFLTLQEGALRNSDGESNKRVTFKFTVGSGLTISTNPTHNATNVSRTKAITMSFNEAVYDKSKSVISPTYLKNNISISPAGDFDMSLSSNYRTVTITPKTPLTAGTRYTVTLPANRVQTNGGKYNSAMTVSFTTSTSETTISPSGATISAPKLTTGDSGTQTVKLTFPADVRQANGGELNSDYLKTNLKFGSTSGGSDITIQSAVSSGKDITLTTEILKPNTTYYLSSSANVFSDSNGSKNVSFNLQSKSPTLQVNMTVPTKEKTTATYKIEANYPIMFKSLVLKDSTGKEETFAYATDLTPSTLPFEKSISGLKSGEAYTLNLSYALASNGVAISPVLVTAFTTEATSGDSTLSSLSMKDGLGNRSVSFTGSAGVYSDDIALTPDNSSQVSFTATANAGEKSTVTATLNGTSLTLTDGAGSFELNPGDEKTLIITVKAEDGTESTYTVNITGIAV